MRIKLTKRQLEVLRILKEEEESILFDKGGGWYAGCEPTNGKLVNSLLRLCLLRADDNNRYGQTEYYEINGSGEEALETGYADISELYKK